jgi:cell division GTPase FtsZ
MYGSSQLLYAGSEHIDRYYGEGKEDDEEFQEFLEQADEAKNKIIQGVIKYMNANGKDLDDMNAVNRFARHFSQKILGLYIALSELGNRN